MKVPKYQLVQNELKQQIISGKFENGDKFYHRNSCYERIS